MLKRIVVSGVLGTIVMTAWAFVANAIFGMRPRLEMMRVSDESAVHRVLTENVRAPGAYLVNPPAPRPGEPPGPGPVYGIRFSGVGHASAGRLQNLHLAIAFLAAALAAWMLSALAGGPPARYARRVLFFVAIGALLALLGDLAKYDIAGYPLETAIIFGASDLVAWTLAGLVIAWWLRPAPVVDAPA